jgi:AAA15 family ATPase/GTPase
MAEGIRKLSLIAYLLKNGRLAPGGPRLLFVDEPEANLHPRAIVLLAEMLHGLARAGIQVFLTTHSYFVIKRLEQLARAQGADHSLLDLRQEGGSRGVAGTVSRLSDGLPDNPILQQSLALFDEDVRLDLGG